MSWKNLFYWSYWFSQPYTAQGRALQLWLGVFFTAVFIGLVTLIARSQKSDDAVRRVLSRFSSCFVTMGILGLLWLFLRQQRVAFLAWRFWLLFWFVGLIFWLLKIAIYSIRRLPKIKAENAERELKNKYLPGK